jgi:hypothetical protein
MSSTPATVAAGMLAALRDGPTMASGRRSGSGSAVISVRTHGAPIEPESKTCSAICLSHASISALANASTYVPLRALKCSTAEIPIAATPFHESGCRHVSNGVAVGGSCVVDQPVVQSACAVRMSLIRCRIIIRTSVAAASVSERASNV